jgi:hypothetical protein
MINRKYSERQDRGLNDILFAGVTEEDKINIVSDSNCPVRDTDHSWPDLYVPGSLFFA